MSVRQIAELVKRFWVFYCNNRHKVSVVTPAMHSAFYDADDGFDRRPILYPQLEGTSVFRQIERRVVELEMEM